MCANNRLLWNKKKINLWVRYFIINFSFYFCFNEDCCKNIQKVEENYEKKQVTCQIISSKKEENKKIFHSKKKKNKNPTISNLSSLGLWWRPFTFFSFYETLNIFCCTMSARKSFYFSTLGSNLFLHLIFLLHLHPHKTKNKIKMTVSI